MKTADFISFNKSNCCPDWIMERQQGQLSLTGKEVASVLNSNSKPEVTLSRPLAAAISLLLDNKMALEINPNMVAIEYTSLTNNGLVVITYDRNTYLTYGMVVRGGQCDEVEVSTCTKQLSALAFSLALEERADPLATPAVQEARDCFNTIKNHYALQDAEASKAFYRLTDNIYRRCQYFDSDDIIPSAFYFADVPEMKKVVQDKQKRTSEGHPAHEKFNMPENTKIVMNKGVHYGKDFEYVSTITPAPTVSEIAAKKKMSELTGKYAWNTGRIYTEEEKAHMRAFYMDDTFTPSEEALDIAEDLKKTFGLKNRRRNYLLVGIPGTGKSTIARQVAQFCNLDIEIFSSAPSTDVFGLTTETIPNTNKSKSVENVNELLEKRGIPTFDDISFDPEGSYERMTGKKVERKIHKNEAFVQIEGDLLPTVDFNYLVFSTWNDLKDKVLKENMENSSEFLFADSPIIRMARKGGVIEIQEINLISDPGTAPALNSLLEEGYINLPNGETVFRHPDCVVIVTMNPKLEGTKELNQSFKERFRLKKRIKTPEKSLMIERVLSQIEDDEWVSKHRDVVASMYDFMVFINKYCKENAIMDGMNFSPRALEDWIIEIKRGKDPYTAAAECFIEKCSDDEEELELLYAQMDNSFLMKIRGRGV